ncbi:MAG: hypothetical protein V4532_16095, partial [Pseudomonadota bacterium]
MSVSQRSRAKKTGPKIEKAPAGSTTAEQAPISAETLALGESVGASLKSMAGLTVPMDDMAKIQKDYVEQASALWNQSLDKSTAAQVSLNDRRFASPEWTSNPGSAFMASMYLLNTRTLQRMADSLTGDEKARERVRFAVKQWADAASPSNFLALNPEAQKMALETKG